MVDGKGMGNHSVTKTTNDENQHDMHFGANKIGVTTSFLVKRWHNQGGIDEQSKKEIDQVMVQNAAMGGEHNSTDTTMMQTLLATQATTLDTLFNKMVVRATQFEHAEWQFKALNMALKAQAHCRATVTALNEIKNPKHVVIANNANIANNQQINNNISHAETKRTTVSQTN